jgi:YebC/PmpR family DNA-binding regulatory protein
MSGHSKWATIHRDKEKNDSKRGAVFTKYAHLITVAARKNTGLSQIVERARAAGLPKDNIQRAIDRATGAGGASLEEVLFEGFLPGGVAVMAEGLTDSKLRLAQQVREAIDRHGGNMGSIGSVSYMFTHLGEIKVKPNSSDELGLTKDDWIVECPKEQISQTEADLRSMNYEIESVELVYKPNALIEVPDPETQEKIEFILNRLDDIDEISKVWTNYA